METKALPRFPNLEQYKKQAKDLQKSLKTGQPEALIRLKNHHPRYENAGRLDTSLAKFLLTDAQLVIAREHGFPNWEKFARQIAKVRLEHSALLEGNAEAAFIEAACVPLDASHSSGTLDEANAILAQHSEVATASIYTAAILGNETAVKLFLAVDPKSASAKGGIRNWNPLTYLCFSRYLRLDPSRSAGLVRAAKLLLDAGADPTTGWFEDDHHPNPAWESVIYGAAGFAHHAEMTRLLLDRGADPNDDETPYHAAESYDLSAQRVLVESGKLNDDSLTTILLRKADWHDYEGMKYLLEHGADPNRMTRWHHTVLHWAIRRDNDLAIIDLLLDHGADPTLINQRDGRSATSMAAHKGRGDALQSIERRGIPIDLPGADSLIAACAKGNRESMNSIAEEEPELVKELIAEGGTLLAEFAGNGNAEGVACLLDLGVDVAAVYKEGDPYFEIARNSTALHFAAWRMRHASVRLLLERGAPVHALDGRGRTALALAIRACVDSHWARGRSLESIQLLLEAGASFADIDLPTGYPEADEVLRSYQKQ